MKTATRSVPEDEFDHTAELKLFFWGYHQDGNNFNNLVAKVEVTAVAYLSLIRYSTFPALSEQLRSSTQKHH